MISIKPDVGNIKAAREHVAGIAAGWPVDAYEVSVVASELVTNAVLHAKTDEIRVDACADGGVYVLKVWDADETLPVACRPGSDVVGGRGLMIVEELAARWGAVRDGEGGKGVFAEWGAS
jgi:anti-sigma regulatory factor (Ser/Thr protein kinase)